MDFSAFDRSIEETYAAEAKARWGESEAYREYEEKGEGKADAADCMMRIFADFGMLKDGDPASDAAQEKVGELQNCIGVNYYTCTDEILMSLGQMYVADERFRANIDAAGGEGTAVFVQKAIAVHCGKK